MHNDPQERALFGVKKLEVFHPDLTEPYTAESWIYYKRLGMVAFWNYSNKEKEVILLEADKVKISYNLEISL